MSAEERSPKRQRRSYSPPSPETKPAFVAQNPHTPPPSVHMSPSWNAQTSSLQQGGTVTFPTPPSTSGFHSQPAGRTTGSEGLDSGKGTPVESGDMNKKDVDGDVTMSEQADAGHRRTDHERQAEQAKPSAGAGAQHAMPLFKLLSKPIARQRPHPSEDLFAMYNLRGIQDSVRRLDPETKKKINKLRKSYEGKLKELGLEGRNKHEKRDDQVLTGLVDPGWDAIMQEGGASMWQMQHGQFDLHGPPKQQFFGKLDGALSLQPGTLSKDEHAKWQHALGLDEPGKAQATNAAGPAKSATSKLLAQTAPVRNSAPASPRAGLARPGRSGKKRRYDESSYEGYEDDGYSTGGMDDRKRQKRLGTRDDPD